MTSPSSSSCVYFRNIIYKHYCNIYTNIIKFDINIYKHNIINIIKIYNDIFMIYSIKINIDIYSNIVINNNFKLIVFFKIISYIVIILDNFTFSNDLYIIHIMTFQIALYMSFELSSSSDIFTNIIIINIISQALP